MLLRLKRLTLRFRGVPILLHSYFLFRLLLRLRAVFPLSGGYPRALRCITMLL
jgi:hypothetical protein